MAQIGRLLSDVWRSAEGYDVDERVIGAVRESVATLCQDYPTYPIGENGDP